MKLSKAFFVYKKTVVKTTWKFRLLLLALFAVVFIAPYRFWLTHLAESLVQEDQLAESDVILIENWNVPELSIFHGAAQVQRAGYARRVWVPQFLETERVRLAGVRLPEKLDELIGLYCRETGLDEGSVETISVEAADPMTLNVARQISASLKMRGVKSVILISFFYHSKRSTLAYRKYLEPEGIRLLCYPVKEVFSVNNWWKTKDGWLTVLLEFVKLNYYRLFWLQPASNAGLRAEKDLLDRLQSA